MIIFVLKVVLSMVAISPFQVVAWIVTEVLHQVPVVVVVLRTLAKENVLDSAKVVRMIALEVVRTTVKQSVQMIVRVTVATTAQRPVQTTVKVVHLIVKITVGSAVLELVTVVSHV